MEFLDTVIGAAIAGLGYLVGTRRRHRPEPVRAICGCTHHRSYHDDDGACHFKTNASMGWVCPCQKYRGPKTLDDLIDEG